MYLRFTKDYFVAEYVEALKTFVRTKQGDWPVCVGREKKKERERKREVEREREGKR